MQPVRRGAYSNFRFGSRRKPRRLWLGVCAFLPAQRSSLEVVEVATPLDDNCAMELTTRMLTPDTWEDFAALVEANNGVWGGCWCMGFHPGGSTGTRDGNRDAKQQLV